MIYVKLLDKVNKDTVIKIDGRTQYEYIFGPEKWEITTMLIHYMIEISNLYEQYQEISEKEAFQLIEKKREVYNNNLEYAEMLLSNSDNHQYIEEIKEFADSFEELEYKIAAILYKLIDYRIIEEETLNDSCLEPNLVYGVKHLLKDNEQSIDEYLELVRSNTIATCVKIKELENLTLDEKDKSIIDKYKSYIDFLCE
jgi:hypothetical protein